RIGGVPDGHGVHRRHVKASRMPAMWQRRITIPPSQARGRDGERMTLTFAVSWLGVIVGNVALLVIGFVWFMPRVFGDRWTAYMGRPGEQLRPGPDFVLSILSGTLNAFVMAVLALNLKATTAADGVLLGLVVFAGFFLSYMTANTVFAKRPWGLWAIDVGHALVAQVVLAVIVTLMR